MYKESRTAGEGNRRSCHNRCVSPHKLEFNCTTSTQRNDDILYEDCADQVFQLPTSEYSTRGRYSTDLLRSVECSSSTQILKRRFWDLGQTVAEYPQNRGASAS